MAGFRLATVVDLPAVVRIHKAAYSKNHFTTLLPDSVLLEYYRLFLANGAKTLLALSESALPGAPGQGDIEGFAVFGTGIPQRVAAFKRECSTQIVLASLRHPVGAAGKVLAGVFNRLVGGRARQPDAECLILSIAAAKVGRGIGSRLLAEVASQAGADGFDVIGLYVKRSNISAINAYFRAGFRIVDAVAGQFYMERRLTQL